MFGPLVYAGPVSGAENQCRIFQSGPRDGFCFQTFISSCTENFRPIRATENRTRTRYSKLILLATGPKSVWTTIFGSIFGTFLNRFYNGSGSSVLGCALI